MPGFRFAPLRYIGKISYGLYLWHWPPLALFYLQTGRVAGPVEAAVLMVLAFAGAVLSYHLVEDPIRRRKIIASTGGILGVVAAGAAAVIVAAAVLIGTQGLILRYPPAIQPFFAAASQRDVLRCDRLYVLMNPADEFCPETSPTAGRQGGVLILGDSHADVLKELLGQVGNATHLPVYLTVRNCDLGRFGDFAFCSDGVLNKIIAQARKAGITDVVAISYWEMDKFDAQSLRNDVARLTGAGLKVHLMVVVPTDPSYDPKERARAALRGQPLRLDGIPLEKYLQVTQAQRDMFAGVVAEFPGQASLLQPADYLCAGSACAYSRNGVPYYLDTNHLTITGANVLRPMFSRLFETIAQESAGRGKAPPPAG